jgi:LPS export ABC transporter protein LptC
MRSIAKIKYKSIVVVILTSMLFSCTNDTQEVRDFLAEKNLPIGIAKEAFHVYKDSGVVTSKLITPVLNDFSNRKNHPYNEFPEGLKIINFENDGKDSVTVIGDYALSYSKTSISEIKGNVVVINHTDQMKLETTQLFWDQKNKYFFTEKPFILRKLTDSTFTKGVGFESRENLTKWVAKKTVGDIITDENEL